MALPSRESKPFPQASALRLCSPALEYFGFSVLVGALVPSALRLRFAAPRPGWGIPLGLTLATPDLAGHAEVARCATRETTERATAERKSSVDPKKKGLTLMNINQVTLIGFTGKDARTSSTQNGRNMTKLSVATTRRYKDAEGNWQQKTQWHTCVAYGPTAEYAAKIQTGSHVYLQGELVYSDYERTVETENGPVKVLWPVSQIVIETISILDRKDKSEQGAA
jgi:single-strand DNA-binding protein